MEIKVTLMMMPQKVKVQNLELNLPDDAGPSQAEKDRYFNDWLLRELKK